MSPARYANPPQHADETVLEGPRHPGSIFAPFSAPREEETAHWKTGRVPPSLCHLPYSSNGTQSPSNTILPHGADQEASGARRRPPVKGASPESSSRIVAGMNTSCVTRLAASQHLPRETAYSRSPKSLSNRQLHGHSNVAAKLEPRPREHRAAPPQQAAPSRAPPPRGPVPCAISPHPENCRGQGAGLRKGKKKKKNQRHMGSSSLHARCQSRRRHGSAASTFSRGSGSAPTGG